MCPLYLSNRFEQAVMTLAIQKAREVISGQKEGGFFGRTALQKIMYFLVRRGVPLPYRFDIYNYGPFCSDVYHDVECLQADGVVEDRTREPRKYWNYFPGPNAEELLEEFEAKLEPWRATVDDVARLFADLRPEHLELIATLDYLYQDEKARLGGPPKKESVVNRFIQVKKDKFDREYVEEMYDLLLEIKIFES